MKRDHIEKAYLLTVQWTVDYEYDFHQRYSLGLEGYKKDKVGFAKDFYDFTNIYSVRRTVKGKKQEVTDSLLKLIIMSDFIHSVHKGEPMAIDNFNNEYMERGDTSILSLLSKFATLCNPSAYTMLDGNSKASLSAILNKKEEYSTYLSFWNDFKIFKGKFILELNPKDTIFWLDILYQRFGINSQIITEEIFQNRLADKYLWVMKNEKR